jgi:asparagine synthetase B (glutamine-hydrolysing)
MCGIGLILDEQRQSPTICGLLLEALHRRGPDHQAVLRLKASDDEVPCTFLSCVLCVQGEMAPQPFVEDGNVLLWNGEVSPVLRCAALHCTKLRCLAALPLAALPLAALPLAALL